MPWGKFRGIPLTEIESGYLCFVLEKCENVRVDLIDAINDELRSRFGTPPPPSPPASPWRKPCPDPVMAARLVAAGLHALAKQHHPDVGGDTATMQKLNLVAEWLKATVPQ
jgi:hypothetical protein